MTRPGTETSWFNGIGIDKIFTSMREEVMGDWVF